MFKRINSLILLGILFVSFSALAGSFTPSPVSPGAGNYTLSDIYNKLTSGSFIYSAHTFNPTGTPASTFVTLSQVWNAIPPHKTLAVHGLDTGIWPAGIYSTATDLRTIEPNLTAANIASGTVMFGITGTYIPPDTTPPTVTAFTIPATASSLTVDITTFTATDNVGVTGFLLSESAVPPASSDPNWSGIATTTHYFSSAGFKTLYAWAKDAANNISASLNDSVTITLPDTTPPTVTAFTIPSTASSLTVDITTFTATDNVGVTGFLLSESAVPPASSDPNWSGIATTTHYFSSAGFKTLYAWAKDAANNISASLNDSVTITL